LDDGLVIVGGREAAVAVDGEGHLLFPRPLRLKLLATRYIFSKHAAPTLISLSAFSDQGCATLCWLPIIVEIHGAIQALRAN
jgi:hypothetical protein